MSLFHSAGTAMQTGMGLVPLTWGEIESWVRCTLYDLSPWELETIRKLSQAYTSEYNQASDPLRSQPYNPAVDVKELDRVAIGSKIGNLFSQFKKK